MITLQGLTEPYGDYAAADSNGAGVYRDITEWADSTPGWMQKLGEIGTEGGILVFVALLLFQWWRARRRDDRSMALALLAPAAVAVVYILSEGIKLLVREERPCREVTNVTVIAECPEPGDWSFPSNHSVIAAAAAATLFVTWRVIGLLALPVAALVAFSRVYVGVHYLHDVAVGYLLGVLLAPVILVALRSPGTRAVTRLRQQRSLALVLGASPYAPPARGPQHARHSTYR